MANDKCAWTYEEEAFDTNLYDTSCGQKQEFMSGSVDDNQYKYCPYCGREIEEVRDGEEN